MSTAPPPVDQHWYEVIIGALVFAAVAALAWMKNFFEGKKAGEPTPAAEVAGKAIGAAIVDQSAANTFAAVAEDVRKIRQIEERREKQEQDEDLVERAVERLRIEQEKKPR